MAMLRNVKVGDIVLVRHLVQRLEHSARVTRVTGDRVSAGYEFSRETGRSVDVPYYEALPITKE